MKSALRKRKDRRGDINAQVEDTLAGIRVVKSFTNEDVEKRNVADANNRFVTSRRDGYKSESYFSGGLMAFTQLMTITVIIFGGVAIVHASLDVADLLTYLLCVSILIDPIQKLVNFGRLYQEGITGFSRFMDMLEVVPDLQDAPDAVDLRQIRGSIEIQDVSFKYQQYHQCGVMNLSLEIQAGE